MSYSNFLEALLPDLCDESVLASINKTRTMNREIKFRAWDRGTSKMIANGFHVIGEVTMFGVIDAYIGENHLGRRSLDRLGDIELMQYTGLKDVDGNEVWEGDIVTTNLNYHGKPVAPAFTSFIRYNEHVGTWQIAYKGAFDNTATDDIGFRYFLKVIGNIYEHPHLLDSTLLLDLKGEEG